MAFDPNVNSGVHAAENWDVALDDLQANVNDGVSLAESTPQCVENNPNVNDSAAASESVSGALSDLGASTADVISLAEYKAAKVEDPDISVNDTSSVADVPNPNLVPCPSVNDGITITEDVDQDTGGEGATELEDGTWTEEECGAAGIMSKGIMPRGISRRSGYMNISVSGTFTATVALQRSFDRGVTWHTVATYTSATETSLTDKEKGVRYRLGIPTTYTSGTAVCRLGIEE